MSRRGAGSETNVLGTSISPRNIVNKMETRKMLDRERFHVIDWGKEHKLLTIESERIDECMRYYEDDESLDGVYLCRGLGYKLDDISFLENHKSIRGLVIPDGTHIDISGIECLTGLRYISISGNRQPIDYSVFPELEEARGSWHHKVVLSDKCRKLRHLCLWHYRPAGHDLTNLPYVPNLEFLGLIQSPIESTIGIGRFMKLKQLELCQLPRLTTLCDMESLPIEIAEVQNCKRLQNLDYFGSVKTLRRLICSHCGAIPSLDFIRGLGRLEHFTFLDVDVSDGDMTPCLRVPYTAFTDKRHFSHTMQQMNGLKKTQ
jgi:protein phosphatase 1 regulatory subunit 7